MHTNYRKINELLMCIERRRRQIGENAMAELDIQPSQHFVLVWLKHMGRAASQNRLAEAMQVTPASVARSLKGLDRDGYIARSGGADSRCNETVITDRGEAMLSRSLSLFQELDARCYEGFSDGELDQLQGLLGRMLENLNAVRNDMEKEIKE